MKMNTGVMLVSKFGYGCSLVSFYKVVGMTASKKSVKLQEVELKFVTNDGYYQAGTVVPSDKIKGKIITKKINYRSDNQPYVKINDYEYAYVWNNTPVWYDSCD